MRWYLFTLPLLLAGCTSVAPVSGGHIYASEPGDKSSYATLAAGGLKAWIRPLNTDKSVQVLLATDDVWVSGGTYVVRYACLTGNEKFNDVHDYPHETTVKIEPGYSYWVQCDDKDVDLKIWNESDIKVDFHTSSEAVAGMFEVLRHLNYGPGGDGFRYSYYNDWGGSKESDFQIYIDRNTKRLTARLNEYPSSVLYLVTEAYDNGARTREAIEKVIPRDEYDADAMRCPKIQGYFDELKKEFMARVNTPHEPDEDFLYTDSPPVYHFYLDIGNQVTANLSFLVEKGALYQSTQEAIDYLKTCGTKQSQK